MILESEFRASEFFDYHVQFKHTFWNDEIRNLGSDEWNRLATDHSFQLEDSADKWNDYPFSLDF